MNKATDTAVRTHTLNMNSVNPVTAQNETVMKGTPEAMQQSWGIKGKPRVEYEVWLRTYGQHRNFKQIHGFAWQVAPLSFCVFFQELILHLQQSRGEFEPLTYTREWKKQTSNLL